MWFCLGVLIGFMLGAFIELCYIVSWLKPWN